MTDVVWNPWHGCIKYSDGCKNCYVYRRDSSIGRDASKIVRTASFDLPLRRRKNGTWQIPDGTGVYLCMTSDFFIDAADPWRDEIWDIIRIRKDLHFTVITKRILRAGQCLPSGWGEGWENFTICCTMENQAELERRFPALNDFPAARKTVICEPLLSAVDMRQYLNKNISAVIAGGESGTEARLCDYEWVLDIRGQCAEAGVPFYFKQTGAKLRKGGKIYRIPRKYQHSQAKKAGINLYPGNEEGKLPWQTNIQLKLTRE